MNAKIINFYKQTSLYTELGPYKTFAKNLPNDMKELCLLQRNQIIHPFDLLDEQVRNNKNSFYGDMAKIPITSLNYENDLFPTAQSMIAELLRRDENYSMNRDITKKIHVCCREQAILLASILKAKGIPARARSGFAIYCNLSNHEAGDHWITEYYSEDEKRWILVDADMCYSKNILMEHGIDFNLLDIPREKFIFGAEAYLGLRENKYKDNEIYYTSTPITIGLSAALHGLFYDFHSLMNHEIIFLHLPRYIINKNYELTEEEYQELDFLANLMLDPDSNFEQLQNVWNQNLKFRILAGGLND